MTEQKLMELAESVSKYADRFNLSETDVRGYYDDDVWFVATFYPADHKMQKAHVVVSARDPKKSKVQGYHCTHYLNTGTAYTERYSNRSQPPNFQRKFGSQGSCGERAMEEALHRLKAKMMVKAKDDAGVFSVLNLVVAFLRKKASFSDLREVVS